MQQLSSLKRQLQYRTVSRAMQQHPPVTSSLSEKAYIVIRDKILRGEFPLGAPLSRRKLASESNMSFLPVSEAIRRLEADGLVESRPRVGTRVRVPTGQDVRDSYVIREALETQAARMFCEKASSRERKELRSLAARLEQMIRRASDSGVHSDFQFSIQTLHVQFHMRVAECTGCVPLYEMLEKNHVLIFNWFYDVSAGSKVAPGRHESLARVLVGDDPDAASLEMGRHIRSGMEEIQDAIAARFGRSLSSLKRTSTQPDGAAPSDLSPWRLRRAGSTRASRSD